MMGDNHSAAPLSEATFYILLSLASGPKHGYAVLKEVEALSAGRLTLSVSTLYTGLARLQEQGLIEQLEEAGLEPSPGLPRKVYSLTGPGLRALEVDAQRLGEMVAAYQGQLGAESR